MKMHVLLAFLLVLPTTAAAEVYKCRGSDGAVVYSDAPCGGTRLEFKPGSVSEVGGLRPTPTPPASMRILPTPTPTPAPAPVIEPDDPKVDPDLPMTENCSVDNPDRDPEFCRPSNLNNVYGDPDRKPRIRPRPRPH